MNDIILNLSDPDYYIEEFWYNFKQSMINFYCTVNKNYNHIKLWSQQLNQYKSNKEYNNIEHSIRDYMTHYSFDLIRYSHNIYYDEIFITNIKRWNKISSMFDFNRSEKHNRVVLFFMILLEIKKKSNSLDSLNFRNSLEPFEDTIMSSNFDSIINYAIENRKSKILDRLKEIPKYNLLENIKRLYPDIDINKVSNMKMDKLIKCINPYLGNKSS